MFILKNKNSSCTEKMASIDNGVCKTLAYYIIIQFEILTSGCIKIADLTSSNELIE